MGAAAVSTTIGGEDDGTFGSLCQLIDSRPKPLLLVGKQQIHLPTVTSSNPQLKPNSAQQNRKYPSIASTL